MVKRELHNKEIIIILDNIRSALNVGAILRTADGAGVKKVFLCGITPNVDHPKIIKTALGAEKFMQTNYFKTTEEAILKAREVGFKICAIEQSSDSISIEEIKEEGRVALIFGNELTGINPVILDLSDSVVEIPMYGSKNSLNVATTVGITVYYLTLK